MPETKPAWLKRLHAAAHQGHQISDCRLCEERVDRMCGEVVWPYTENNVCVLEEPHEGQDHQDSRGRRFMIAGYVKGERDALPVHAVQLAVRLAQARDRSVLPGRHDPSSHVEA